MPFIELPNKKYFRVPEGLTDEEALGLAKQRFPFLYESQGIVGRGARALGRGFEELGESAKGIALGARTAMGDTEYGQRAIQEQKAAAIEEAKKPQALSVKQLEDIWKMQGIGSALSHVPSYVTEQILQNAPSMATPLAAGAAGTAFGGPLAGLAAGIGTYGLQQFGQFMQRQAATPGRTGETFEPVKAAATAAVSAPIGFLVDRFTLGLGRIPEKAAAQLILKEIAARKTGETLARGAFRGLLEMPTEVLEQAAERYQAGLSLTDAEAKAEYKEAAAGALAVGAVGGAGSAYRERGKAQEFVEMQNLLDKAKQQQAAQQQAEQQAQARAAQTQQTVEAPFAVGPQGRLFEGEASALPVGQSMQALYAQLKKAEADGDTRTASILRNDINRLTAQLNNPDLLRQQRDALEEEKNKLTEQLGQVAAVDPVKAKELYQRGLNVNNQIKQVEALLKQLPQQRTAKQVESLQKRFAAAREVDDQEKMLTLGAQLAEEGPRTGDLLAGVPLLPGELPSERVRREQAEEIEAGYLREQPPATLTPDALSVAQQELEAEDRARAQKEAEEQEKNARERLEKIEERRMRGMPKTGKEPTIATATSPRQVVFETGAEREVPAQFGYTPSPTTSGAAAKEKEAALLTKLGAELGVVEGEKPLNVAQFRLQQKEHAQEKESALFDMATTVDSLRKNDTRDTRLNKNVMQFGFAEGQRRNAFEAKNKVIDSLIKEINSFRDQYDTPHLTKKQEEEIKTKVSEKFDPLIARAQPDITQQGNVLHDALQAAINKKIKEVKARAKDPTKRAGIKALVEELNQLRAKQNAIPRGVSFSKERAAKEYGTIPEFTSWQRFINKIAFNYAPKPLTTDASKGRIAPGAVSLELRRPSQQLKIEKETEARGEKEKTLSEELAKSRKYALLKVKSILSTRTLDKETKNVFQQVEERLENERGTRELLKEIYEAVSRIAIGQKADIASLQRALKTEEEVIQTGEQGELFVEKGREERAPAQMLTSVKRATPSSFAKFAAAIRKRTDEAVVAFINKQNLPEKINALEKDIAYLDKKVAELFGTRLDAAVNRLFNLAKKQTALTLGDTSFKSKWEKLFSSKKWTSTNDIINARLKLQETDFLNKLKNLVKNVESSKANKIIAESKEWLEDKELFQQFFNESGFFDLKKWNKALKTELRLRSIGPQGLATQQVNAEFARNLKALEAAKEALDSLKANVNALTKSGVLKYSFGPHIGEFRQINNASLIQDIKTATERIEKNIELRRISNVETQKRAAKQQDLQKAQEAVKKAAESVRTFETEFVPVKTAPKNTELGKIQDEIIETQNKIFALGAELNIQSRKKGSAKTRKANLHSAYLRVDIDPNLIRTSKQRSLNNQRLGFIEKRARLLERMVMRRVKVTTQTAGADVVETTPNFEQAYAIASRVLPNKHAILTSQLTEVRERLKDKKQTKARIKNLEEKKADLNQQLLEVERKLKKFGIKLTTRVFSPEDTAKAQQKAMREMEAAEARGGFRKAPITLKEAVNPEAETGQQIKKRKERLSLDQVAASYGITSVEDVRAFEQAYNDERKTDFRDASSADSGVDTKAAADVAARITKALPSGINVVYAPTLKDAPPAFLAALYRSGKTTAKGAVLPDGTVVVVGEAHKNTADLEETFAHELIGHYGVDMVLGPERMQALTDRLFKQGEDHVAQVATALGVFPDIETALAAKDALKNKDVQMSIAREMIAHAAEGRRVAPTFSEKVKTFVRDMIAAVRAWFRSAGLSDLAKQDAKEIQKLIREASDSLAAGRGGIYISPNGEVAFRPKQGKMPKGFEELQDFSNSAISQQQSWASRLMADSKGLAFKVAYIDQLAAFEQLRSQMDDTNAAMQMMYFLQKHQDLLQMASASASVGALDLIESDKGVYRIAAKKGASLRTTDTALKPLLNMGFDAEGANQLFTSYMAALRGEQEGYDKLNFNPEIIAKAKRVIPVIEANKDVKAVLETARAEYNEYNKGLITFAEKTGAISKEEADRLRAKKDYIPYYRDDNGILNMYVGGETPIKIGNLKDQPYLQRLVGGDQPIMDYFTSSMQNTMLLTDMGLRNIAVKNTAFTLQKINVAKIGRGDGPSNANVLRFKEKGEPKFAVIDTKGTAFENIPTELLAKGMEGMTVIVPDWLKMMALPAQVLRKGITLNPVYPYYQLAKDSMVMGATRGVGFSNAANVMRGVKEYTSGDDMIEEMQARGVASGQGYTGTIDDVAQIRRHVMQKGTNPYRLIAALENNSLKADAAVRSMLYKSYIKQGLNERDAEYMTITAMPYSRRGISPGLRFVSYMLPFFNAQIVGLHSMYQAFTGKMPYADKVKIRKKLWGAGMMMALSTLAYVVSVEDEDWYKNMPLETRLRNWFVKLPFSEEPIAIPIPFEFGILFKGFAEATYLGMFKDSPEGEKVRDAYRKILLSAIPGGTIPVEAVPGLKAVPVPLPTAIAPILEIASNKSFSGDRPIESQSELSLKPEERFRDTTSELSKSLGKTMGVSPLQIDHLIRGYSGTLGPAFVALIDAFTGPEAAGAPQKAEVPLSKLPILSQMFKPADGNALVDLAVSTLKDAEQVKNTYEHMVKQPGREAEAEAYLERNMPLIERGGMARKLQSNLGQIKQAIQSIQADTTMTPIEKREAIKEMQQIRIGISKQYQEAFKQAE